MTLRPLLTHPAMRRVARTLCACLLAWGAGVAAAPGAHGPDGEHLDAAVQAGTAGTAVTGIPGFEAQSELFELVARLEGGRLSLMIDRFETNEPVLDAVVEVACGGLKAMARFQAPQGDYAVDDAPLLQRLSTPGEHAVLVTVLSGQDSDLLDGMLRTGPGPAPAAAPGQGLRRWLPWLAAPAAAGLLLWGWRRRRASATSVTSVEGGRA